MSRDEIQRMMGGSDADTDAVLATTADSALADPDPSLSAAADGVLDVVADLEAALLTNEPLPFAAGSSAGGPLARPEAGPEAGPAAAAAASAVETLLPAFSQRIAGASVVVVVDLPRLTGAGDASLDIAPRYLKLRGAVPQGGAPQQPPPPPQVGGAPGGESAGEAAGNSSSFSPRAEYLLSIELSETVDPAAATAKWSKKKKTLTVTIPIVV